MCAVYYKPLLIFLFDTYVFSVSFSLSAMFQSECILIWTVMQSAMQLFPKIELHCNIKFSMKLIHSKQRTDKLWLLTSSSTLRLCSGSLITERLNCVTLIKISRLHLGQNSGKFRSSVSDRILMRVLLPQTGHNNYLNCSFPSWFMVLILAFFSQYNAADNADAAQ